MCAVTEGTGPSRLCVQLLKELVPLGCVWLLKELVPLGYVCVVTEETGPSRLCVRLLKELVKTYTETDADQGRSYAEALIVHSVADSSTFVMEDLLQLPAIRLLEGEKIHQVLVGMFRLVGMVGPMEGWRKFIRYWYYLFIIFYFPVSTGSC